MTGVRFFRVSALPSSGYAVGGLYFVTPEQKIYLRTSTGWEEYSGKVPERVETAGVAERLAGVVESGGDDPVVIEDPDGRETLTVTYDSNASVYYGANVILRKYNNGAGSYDERRMELCGRGVLISTVDADDVEHRINIEAGGILIQSGSITINGDTVPTYSTVQSMVNADTPLVYSSASSSAITLSTSSRHRLIVSLTSGNITFNLPAYPRDGETFVFMKIQTGGTVTINGNGKSIFLCASGTEAESATMSSSIRRRATLLYSSSRSQWLLMADDFLGI